MIKFWGRPNSICTQRVLWACDEVGAEWELELASGTMGPNGHISTGAEPYGHVDTDAYRAMNPNGTVPTMMDGNLVLWDSIAIVCHIANRYGPATLYSNSQATLAQCIQWMCWTNEHLEPLLHTLVMELVRLKPEERDAQVLEMARKKTIEELAILERHLSDRDYLAGTSFSLGDIPAGATVYRWLVFDLERPAMPNLENWQARLQERHAFQNTHCTEESPFLTKSVRRHRQPIPNTRHRAARSIGDVSYQ